MTKYTFNASEDSCMEIVYGGCYGTKNLFETLDQCEQTCKNIEL